MRAKLQALILPYIIENGKPLFCVLHRSDRDVWQFVSGGGEDDETPLEAARRECFEEIGTPLDAPIVQLQSMCHIPANIYAAYKQWGEDTILVPEYSFALRMDSRVLKLSHEHTEYEWLDYDTAYSRLQYDSNRTAMWELSEKLRLGRFDIGIERVMPTHIIAAAGVVINDRDEVLMVKTHNYGWVFPGGQVEVGENAIDAVKREIMEEAGVDVEVGDVFCISSNIGKYPGYNGVKEIPTKIMLDFICRAKSGVPRPSEENSESKYVAKDTALELIKAPAIIERYKAYLKYDGRPTYLAYVTKPSFELRVKRSI